LTTCIQDYIREVAVPLTETAHSGTRNLSSSNELSRQETSDGEIQQIESAQSEGRPTARQKLQLDEGRHKPTVEAIRNFTRLSSPRTPHGFLALASRSTGGVARERKRDACITVPGILSVRQVSDHDICTRHQYRRIPGSANRTEACAWN
jgi:hypothetical protein